MESPFFLYSFNLIRMISTSRILILLLCIGSITMISCNQEISAGPEQQNPTLLISFDGFRYDYLERVNTPHFDSLITDGVQAERLIPVFPSTTFPNHYSIVTGLYPENSGMIGNTMFDPEWDEWYRINNREAVEDEKWYEGEPIWNTLEKQDIRTGTMFWVGSEADIQGMHPTYWKSYDENMTEEARIDTVIKWLSYPEEQAVDFATLYFEHVDSYGHSYGLQSDSLNAAILKTDHLIGYLKTKMRKEDLWDKTNIVIVSDHGMVELSADKIIEIDKIIDMNKIERTIWGPVTMLQPKGGLTDEVYNKLKANEKNYMVYLKEDLPERFHLKNHRRIPDIVLVADIGYVPVNRNTKERFLRSLPAATHGYDNAEKLMHAFFIAHGPAFREGEKVSPFQNIHIYELINKLMYTDPASNDGNLDSVRVLLN